MIRQNPHEEPISCRIARPDGGGLVQCIPRGGERIPRGGFADGSRTTGTGVGTTLHTLLVGFLYWLLAAHVAPVQADDTQFANFAFASELGSGVYEVGGRIIQVYQFPIKFALRDAVEGQSPPGLNLMLPVTVGFFDFKTKDLAQLDVPNHLDALSFEPGVELDYWLNDAWHIYPYAKVGGSFSSGSGVSSVIWGVGIGSDYHFRELDGSGLWRAAFNYAGVHFRGDVPDDYFTRLRNGAELREKIPWSIDERNVEIAPYGAADIYFHAPSGPASGISERTLQFETGVMLGVSPMWEIFGITLPRLGVGYRFAGEFSGWRLVIGDPF